MKYLLLSVIFFSFISYSQNVRVSEKTVLKSQHSKLDIIGETDNFIYVEKFINAGGGYGKKSTIYKYNKNLKLINQIDYKTLYEGGKKDLYVFGEKIITLYTLKVGKSAIVYYDIIDALSLELKSEKNVLYEYKYKKFVNSSLIDTHVILDESHENILINLYIHELISPVKEGGNFGYFLKLDKDLNKIYSLKYKDYRKKGSTNNSLILKNGDFAFVSYNQEEISIHTIKENSGVTSQTYKIEGFFIAECKLIETNKGLLLSGLYSNSNLYVSDNHFYQGIFYTTTESNEIVKIPFSEYKSDGVYESDFHKISTKYSEYIGVVIEYDEDINSLVIVVFNNILSFDKIVISKINLNDESVDFNVVKVSKGHTKTLIDLVFIEGEMKMLFHENTLKVHLMPHFNTKVKNNGSNTWESLTVSMNDISETSWLKHTEKSGVNIEGSQNINTVLVYGDAEYFKLFSINY